VRSFHRGTRRCRRSSWHVSVAPQFGRRIDMRAVTAAMLWELWRVSRWELAIRIVGASFWAILVGMFLGWAALENESQRAVLQGIAMLLLFCSGLFSTSWLGQL